MSDNLPVVVGSSFFFRKNGVYVILLPRLLKVLFNPVLVIMVDLKFILYCVQSEQGTQTNISGNKENIKLLNSRQEHHKAFLVKSCIKG